MRFIDTTTLELVNKRDDEIPRYAILSHTWGRDEEEVSLQEMQQILASREEKRDDQFSDLKAQRQGFDKIRQASRVARDDGFEYIWIDTCCIDKTSSAELSEAINSMFRWYQESAMCYTFLVDVNEGPERQVEKDTQESRWFTRGWTLQELIAPASMDFYSRAWTKLGTKVSLCKILVGITGIDQSLLGGLSQLSDFSVARRMSWASGRKTTRVEDRAYCLMGIFNVNMPLLYGEGPKAFLRLQQEILNDTHDHSLFAWKFDTKDRKDLSGPRGLLAQEPSWFRGSSNMRPLPGYNVTGNAPSTNTSLGLSVQLFLIPFHQLQLPSLGHRGVAEETFYAILDCAPYRTEGLDGALCRPAILILHLGGEQYARAGADDLFDVPVGDLEKIKLTRTLLYVKQDPGTVLFDLVVDYSALVEGEEPRSTFLCREIQSLGTWDASTWTLQYRRLRPDGNLVAFRFLLDDGGSDKPFIFDLFVGRASGRFDPQQSLHWCYMQEVTEGQPFIGALPLTKRPPFPLHGIRNIRASITAGSGQNKSYQYLTLKLFRDGPGPHPTIFPGQIQGSLTCLIPPFKLGFGRVLTQLLKRSTFRASIDCPALSYLSPPEMRFGRVVDQPIRYSTSPGAIWLQWRQKRMAAKLEHFIPISTQTLQELSLNARERDFLKSCVEYSGDEPKPIQIVAKSAPADVFRENQYSTWHKEPEGSRDSQRNYRKKVLQKIKPFSTSVNKARPTNLGSVSLFDGFTPLMWAVSKIQHRYIQQNAGSRVGELLFPPGLPEPVGEIRLVTGGSELIQRAANLFRPDAFKLTAWHYGAFLGATTALELLNLRYHELSKIQDESRRLNTNDRSRIMPIDGKSNNLPPSTPSWEADHPINLAASYLLQDTNEVVVGLYERNIFEKTMEALSKVFVPDDARNALGETPFHRAAANNNHRALNWFFQSGSKLFSGSISSFLEAGDHMNRTPIWHAAATGSLHAVKALLGRGADPNTRDEFGRTALHAAARHGSRQCVDALLKAGANIDARTIYYLPWEETNGSFTCLTSTLYAVLSGDLPTLQCVLEAEVKEKYKGSTKTGELFNIKSALSPLHVAAMNGWYGGVRALCVSGYEKDMEAKTRYVVISEDDAFEVDMREEDPAMTPLELALRRSEETGDPKYDDVILYLRGVERRREG